MLTHKEELRILRKDNVGPWVRFRRCLRIYSAKEKQSLFYANAIKRVSDGIVCGSLTITARPQWMRYEEYNNLRKLQNRVDKKRKA